jgi:MFS family permease
VIPAVLAVAVLVLGVKEPSGRPRATRVPLQASEIGALGAAYWLVVVAGAIFTLARFSEAFLVIRAMDGGLALAWAPAVIAVMSLVYAASAYPAGRLQDRIGARPLLLLGLCALIAADLVLAAGSSLLAIFIGIGLWGLHMGLTQGVLAALIAATAPERLRGTAFGLFGLITGLAALVASVLAGLLWDRIGAGATFLAGAAFAATALIAFLLVKQDPGAAGK